MPAKTLIGYLLALLGIASVALGSIAQLRTALNLPSLLSPTLLLIAGLILLVIGVLLAMKKASKQPSEVPIYQGKNVVGYRRIGK